MFVKCYMICYYGTWKYLPVNCVAIIFLKKCTCVCVASCTAFGGGGGIFCLQIRLHEHVQVKGVMDSV